MDSIALNKGRRVNRGLFTPYTRGEESLIYTRGEESWICLSLLDKRFQGIYSINREEVKRYLEQILIGRDNFQFQCPVDGCSGAFNSTEELKLHLLQNGGHTSVEVYNGSSSGLTTPFRVVLCLTARLPSSEVVSGEISNAAPGSSDIYIIYFVALIILFMSLYV
jgi:hypothetical protein